MFVQCFMTHQYEIKLLIYDFSNIQSMLNWTNYEFLKKKCGRTGNKAGKSRRRLTNRVVAHRRTPSVATLRAAFPSRSSWMLKQLSLRC